MVVAFRRAPYYGIRSLSGFTLMGAFQAISWNRTTRHTALVRDDVGSFSIFIERTAGFDLLEEGSVTLEIEDDTDGTQGVLWDITDMGGSSKVIDIPVDATEVEIPITIYDIGGWFEQREVLFKITTPVNCQIAEKQTRCRLQFEPSDAPPTISITSSGGSVDSNTIDVFYELSAAVPLDDVALWWEKSGALAASVSAPNGVTMIAAGQTTGSVTFTHDGGGSPGDPCTVTPHYERTTVAYVDHRLDQSIPGGRFSVPYNVYVDQNLACYSNQFRDGIQETPDLLKAAGAPLPFLPGYPTSLASGGIAVGTTTGAHQAIVDPTEATPVDPLTGEKIAYQLPASDVVGYPYIRQQFDMTLAGGNRQLVTLRKYIYGAYQIASFVGADAGKHHWAHEIGYRIRSLDLNIAIAICSTLRVNDSTPPPGTDVAGNTGGTVVTIGGNDFWFWEQINGHPTNFEWGIEEGPDGNPLFWFKDELDESLSFAQAEGQFGDPSRDSVVFGFDEGNYIYRPSRVKDDRKATPKGGVIAVTAVDSGNKFTRVSGSWLDDGYVEGDSVSTKDLTGNNLGVFTVGSGVTANDLPISDANLDDESGGQLWITGSIASTQEGYSVLRAAEIGTPVYNVQFQMSDTPFPAGALPFWPNFHQNHSPRGNAMMIDSPTGHTFTRGA